MEGLEDKYLLHQFLYSDCCIHDLSKLIRIKRQMSGVELLGSLYTFILKYKDICGFIYATNGQRNVESIKENIMFHDI